ncbi:TPA: hypothetical protein HA351_07750 [Methanosarcinaceae archaeon]|nr:hypothetical protein [Methanosarcinaceae archaeon]
MVVWGTIKDSEPTIIFILTREHQINRQDDKERTTRKKGRKIKEKEEMRNRKRRRN